jgi:hypothetical protein
MNNRIYFALILLVSLTGPTLAWSAPCITSGGVITSNAGACTLTPETYRVHLYKTGLCNNIDPSSATPPDMDANCITTFDSGASPLAISVVDNVSQPITGGTVTRPPNRTYTHGFVLIEKTIDIKTSVTFSTSVNGPGGVRGSASADRGLVCWTMTGTAGAGYYTMCGSSVDNSNYGFTSSIVNDLGTGGGGITCTDHFHCTYIEAPYDTTYAYLLNGSVKATSTSGVTALLGFAAFTSPVTVDDASTAMDVKFRVTQGVTVDPSGGAVNLYTAVFKTITAIR